MSDAFATLITNEQYVVGALVLGHSLRESKTSKKLVCMVTDKVTSTAALKEVFDVVHVVTALDTPSPQQLKLLKRPELVQTLTKIWLWTLPYQRVCFMDADTFAIQNIDDIFDQLPRDSQLAACSDIGWPDAFNSGVFVARPSKDTFNALVEEAEEHGSFDGGDQGLLNQFFPKWHRIPFIYNVAPSSVYSYAPAFRYYASSIKVVHFLGTAKPWNYERFEDGTPVVRNGDLQKFVSLWWQCHDRHYKTQMTSSQGQQVPISYKGRTFQSTSSGNQGYSDNFGHQQSRGSADTNPNPFFKNRYDWDEQELGSSKPAKSQTASTSRKSNPKLTDDDDDEGTGQRKLPLKKTTAAPAKKQAPSYVAPPSK